MSTLKPDATVTYDGESCVVVSCDPANLLSRAVCLKRPDGSFRLVSYALIRDQTSRSSPPAPVSDPPAEDPPPRPAPPPAVDSPGGGRRKGKWGRG